MEETPPVVFLGPTLDHFKAASLVGADFKPPAAMGDIMRAVTGGASAIVLIDGFFESGPSVWHKEILFALKSGIPVIGASSMGALRAAELHGLGMLGYGQVYEDFANGTLNDDDEVAVLHGPAETGWMQLSDAMVDIRTTMQGAVAAGAVSEQDANLVLQHAKATHFKERSLKQSLTTVLGSDQFETNFKEWLDAHDGSKKRRDCISLLQHLPAVIEVARKKLHLANDFVPTLYMKRLNRFGYKNQRER